LIITLHIFILKLFCRGFLQQSFGAFYETISVFYISCEYFNDSTTCLLATNFDVEWSCQENNNRMELNCWNPNTHIPNNNPGEDRFYDVHLILGEIVSATIDDFNNWKAEASLPSDLTNCQY